MFETSPSQPASDCIDVDLAELADPIASVVAVELSRRVIRRGLSWAEPMVTDLAAQETVLRQAGGIDLVKRIFAQRFYRRVDAEVFQLLRRCVPLAHADFVLSRVEVLLRTHFADIVGTAASHLLSHDRDTAIQMTAVAATMAGREVHTEVMAIMAEMRLIESDAQ
ncbi:MAG: hypothetical protein WBC17_02900 [Mycobacterium sp.]|jgi:hypothetical protein|nr:hypothetical protein [Mycobacterium sp.]